MVAATIKAKVIERAFTEHCYGICKANGEICTRNIASFVLSTKKQELKQNYHIQSPLGLFINSQSFCLSLTPSVRRVTEILAAWQDIVLHGKACHGLPPLATVYNSSRSEIRARFGFIAV